MKFHIVMMSSRYATTRPSRLPAVFDGNGNIASRTDGSSPTPTGMNSASLFEYSIISMYTHLRPARVQGRRLGQVTIAMHGMVYENMRSGGALRRKQKEDTNGYQRCLHQIRHQFEKGNQDKNNCCTRIICTFGTWEL